MIDLREKDQQTLSVLAEHYLPDHAQLWAYGSRVKGTHHDTSDLDLVIKMPSGHTLPADTLADFQTVVQDSNIPILVQVFDWGRMPTTFKANVETHHHILWKGQAYAQSQ